MKLVAEDTLDIGTSTVAVLGGHVLSFSPHFVSDWENKHITRNLRAGLGFPQREYTPTVSGFPGDRRPQQTYVLQKQQRVVNCLKNILSIPDHKIILSLNQSRPRKAERQDPFDRPASRITATELSCNIRAALKETVRNKPQRIPWRSGG